MKALPLYLFVALTFSLPALAADELILSATQKKTLGIASAALLTKKQGELAGMPAQVVIPGNQLFTISTPLAAMVEQILVGVGDAVKKGQVLATLQSPALAEAQRGLLQASTQSQLAKENLARDEKLWQEGIIAESRLRATQSQSREASAGLAERKQMLKLSGMSDSAIALLQTGGNLNSLLSITSPITGVILEKSAIAGQRIEGAIPLFKVAKLDPLALEIQASLSNIQGIKLGATVTVPDHHATGKLTAIGRSLSGGNQTILLRAMIFKGTEFLRPGQFVEVNIETSSSSESKWTVPNAALARVESKTFVFVETANGYRPVTASVLQEGAQSCLVDAKFVGDEKIAIKGVSALKAKMMGIGE
ncbi:MAG: efflux RND transporter periplasmic adaptor subunit [Gallionellaceae bacterium]